MLTIKEDIKWKRDLTIPSAVLCPDKTILNLAAFRQGRK